jgi:catechol 2,3-dioxygenase
VPDRPSLAGVLMRIAKAGVRLGASDHLVSEALYIWDHDNNGLEVYRDRPRSEWSWDGKSVRMATDPLDLRNLAAEVAGTAKEREPMPAGTRMGHVHLQVGNLDIARKFYCDVLGFEQTAGRGGALFVSAGGYHHHIGLNTWHSLNGPPPAEGSAGLVVFEITVPDRSTLLGLKSRVQAAGHAAADHDDGLLLRDPSGTPIRVLAAVRT